MLLMLMIRKQWNPGVCSHLRRDQPTAPCQCAEGSSNPKDDDDDHDDDDDDNDEKSCTAQ